MKNDIVLKSLANPVISSAAVVGTVLDLANFVEVGKRNLKLTVSVVDCKSTGSSTTDQTISATWYESDTTLSSEGTAITGAAVSASTASGMSEFNVLVSKRYVFCSAAATGTSPVWGVVANAIALSRSF